MYFKKWRRIGILSEYKNSRGDTYFADLQIGCYLFSSNQVWGGVHSYSKKGDFMLKHEENKKFIPFGKWRKQKDGTLIIFVKMEKKLYGIIGIKKAHSIWLYWADTESQLEKLFIKDNPNIKTVNEDIFKNTIWE